jgi:hypothetical protein
MKIDKKEYSSFDECVKMISDHFGIKTVHTEKPRPSGCYTVWPVGTTWKKMIGFIVYQNDQGKWLIGGTEYLVDWS